MNMKRNLLGKYVRFHVGRKAHWGRVSSIERGIANIRGIEQTKHTQPAYHYPINEIVECTHDKVYDIGRSIGQLFR